MNSILLKVIKCTGLSALRGNMVRKEILPLYFETRWGVHTFFVKESIDVLILDEENIIRAIKKGLKPRRIFFWNPKYRRVVELPKETHSLISLGEKVDIVFYSDSE